MVLITGASSGIGEACAKAFAERNLDLVLVARRLPLLDKLGRELSSRFGVRVQTVELDVSDKEGVARFAQKESRLLSQVTVLVNNAGLAKGMATIQEGKTDDWDTMIDTNLKGLLYVTHALLPHFTQKKSGHIVNLGSVAGHWTYPRGNIYCATKSAVHALNEAMRLDLHGLGIRVTEISPGMVETDFSRVRLGDEEKARAVYAGLEALTAEDVAQAVVWAVDRPARVNIQEIILYPTAQASPTLVQRS
ncbi:SDR family NAD(P)-dependent oxidoreductase [bacterium]|nr:SDR family NAD(P)-dependent oxidoreductase [bacterium]